MESQALATISAPRSKPCESPSKKQLIRLWIGKLALNAGQALKPVDLGVTEALWLEGFDDLPCDVLEAAFKKALKVCKFWPVKVADIREHVEHAKETATNEAAERAWEHVIEIRRTRWCPDAPGGFYGGQPELPERIAQAARASGVFREHESVESLHVWARKRFVESFIAWGKLEQDKFLLPDGEIKNLLTGAAQTKALPGSRETYEEMHERGLQYAQGLKTSPAEDSNIKRAIRAFARELAPRPSTRPLEDQKRILREKGFLPAEAATS